MCDYSLEQSKTRLAIDGEQLLAHRFPRGSMGLASPAELHRPSPSPTPGRSRFWAFVRSCFEAPLMGNMDVTAVCIPPGARLVLRDIPKDMQRRLEVSDTEEVTFVQLSAEAYRYRDAIRFRNGRQVLLQVLREGQPVDVMSTSLPEEDEVHTTPQPVFQRLDPGLRD
jgi:hypothetical protein